jgi:CheY-like chemotaxis protein
VLQGSTAVDILDALRGYLWIGLAAVIIWRLFPVIRRRIESEDFTVEVAGQKVSFSSASTQLGKALADLRRRVVALEERVDQAGEEQPRELAAEEAVATRAALDEPPRILWVDDHPENNAFLIASLYDQAADVVEVATTDEALEELTRTPEAYDVVISDMGRKERGVERPLAGVDLVRRAKERGVLVPIVIYSSPDAVARDGEQARRAGAAAVTASPTELLGMLRLAPTTAFEAEMADGIRRRFRARPFPLRRTVDYVADRDGERIGIEIKNWARTPAPKSFRRSLEQLDEARERHGLGQIVMITRDEVDVPAEADLPPWLEVMTAGELAPRPDKRDPG